MKRVTSSKYFRRLNPDKDMAIGEFSGDQPKTRHGAAQPFNDLPTAVRPVYGII